MITLHSIRSSHLVFGLMAGLSSLVCFSAAAQSSAASQSGIEHNLRFQNLIVGEADEGMALQQRMAALHVPGVSIALIHRSKLSWAKAYGVVALGGAPVAPTTLFNAASMSKPLTAVAVLKLAQGGRVDLDAPVNRYLTQWKIPENQFTVGHPVTIRQLLNHTSGIGTHNGEVSDPDKAVPTLLQMLNGQKPATTEAVHVEAQPGQKYAYANGGYMVLQLLLEEVTGKPFARYMQETILKPLHMSDSTFVAPLSASRLAHAATGYQEDDVHSISPAHFVKPNLAAGGLWTTAPDYAKFVIELQREYAGKSHLLLSQQMARTMVTAGMGPSSTIHWGLGIRVGGTSPNLFFEHGGSGIFQNESIGYLNGDGIVILTNGGRGGDLVDEVARSAAHVYHWPDFQPQRHTVVKIDASSLDKFVGSYDFIKVVKDGDHLMAEIPLGTQKQQLYPESTNQFFILDSPTTLVFDQDDSGKTTGIEFITTYVHWHRPKSK